MSQVPPFFTPGVPENSTWDKVYESTPRSFKDIDYIFILHATNDGLVSGPLLDPNRPLIGAAECISNLPLRVIDGSVLTDCV